MAEETWFRLHYRLWHDAIGRSLKLPAWLFLTFGPFFLDLVFTSSAGKTTTTTVPIWAWIIWWLCSVLFQFAYGVGEVVRELESTVDTQTPKLAGRVEWHRLGRLADGTRILLAALRIDNTGAKTKVSNWRMITRPGTGEQNKPEIDGDDVTVTTDDGDEITCQMSQYLPFVLNGKPLGKTYRQGFVIFKVKTEPSSDDEITYTFRDREGTLYLDTKRRISDRGEIKSFPPELTVDVTR